MAGLVGRTEWKMSPANRIRSGRCSSRSSTALRNASATSASRWFPPRGVCRSYWRKPRCRSARWASFTASLGLSELERRLLLHRHGHLALRLRALDVDLHRPAHGGAHRNAARQREHLLPGETPGKLHGDVLALLRQFDRLSRE